MQKLDSEEKLYEVFTGSIYVTDYTPPYLGYLWLKPIEVHKAVIQAKMISGRYVTDKPSRYWTQNKAGICSIPTCTGLDIGSLEHLLLVCPALSDARERMVELWLAVATEHQDLQSIQTCNLL